MQLLNFAADLDEQRPRQRRPLVLHGGPRRGSHWPHAEQRWQKQLQQRRKQRQLEKKGELGEVGGPVNGS